MTDNIVVLNTCETEADAERLARALVAAASPPASMYCPECAVLSLAGSDRMQPECLL